MSRTSIPLWHNLSRAEHYRYLSRFVRLAPSDMASLEVSEFALLMQWIFAQRGLEAQNVDERDGRVDLVLINRKHRRDEFARIYFKRTGVPVNALWDLLKRLEGMPVKRIYFCTVGVFPEAQKRLQDEFPFVMDIVEGGDLERYLRESQRTCRSQFARQAVHPASYRGTQRRGLWASIKQRLLDWLRM